VTAWDTTLPTLSGNTVRNGTPGFANNGILPAYYVDATSNTFLSYNSTTGFQSVLSTLTPATNQVAYSNIFAGGVFSTNTNANSIVDITTGAVTLTQDQTVYALRTSQNISSGVGQYNTLTFADGATDADRGGLIITNPGGDNTTVTIATNLKFGTNGNKEGIVYFQNPGGTNRTATISGDIYAGSITKFGSGNLIISKDLTAAANGTGFAGNWTVNGGALTLNTFGASGDGGTITLNASGTVTAAGTTLNLLAQPGNSLNGQYTVGRIISVDNSIIVATPNLTDSVVGISDLESFSTDTTGLSPARLRVQTGNTRSVLNAGTLFLTGAGGSILDINAGAVNNQITSGATGSGLNVTGLNGSRDLIKWGNGYLWVGGNNTSFTGNVSIEQGALGITNANALVNAASITARRYGVLDILTTGFTKAVTYEAGSVERWSVDNARSGTINLGGGSLQVNADQNITVATIQMNGGSIEGFLRTDDVSSNNSGVVFRTLGSGVSISLLGNSFVGQNYFTDGVNGTDNGRASDTGTGIASDVNNSSEQTNTARGAILEIKGNISGAGGLTKQSTDTVILSGTNTYNGATNIANGTLRLGSAAALPNGTNVTTSSRGVLDLGGFNASIGNLNSSVITGAAFSSSSGFITNSATVMKTLTVTPTTDSSYSGVVQNNINVIKSGAKKLVFTNMNTYTGDTTVNGGVMEVSHVTSGAIDGISGTSSLTVASGATFNLLTGTTGGVLTLAPSTGTILNLANGSRLGVEVGTTGSSILLNTGAKAQVTGNVTVDAYFLSGQTPGATSTILAAASGGLVSTNGSTGTYSLGNLYNVTNFKVTGITATDTLVYFNTASTASLTAAYWKGGYSGAANVWAVSDGSTSSNWATDLAGTATGLVPNVGTDVFLSATSNTNQNSMVLGANMSINSLTVNAQSAGNAVVLNSDGGYTLTIANGITTDVGSSAATINSKVALSAATATITVNSTNALAINGAVSGTAITKAGAGTLVLGGINTYTGATTVSAGVLSAANNLALGTTAGVTTVSSGASLELQGGITIAGEALTINGTGASNSGALRNLSGDNIFNGNVALGSASNIQSDAGTLSINGGISGAFGLTVAGAGNTVINGIIGTAAGTLTKNDSGTLTLANANTYIGATTINGGTVSVSNATGLGTTAAATTVNAGGALNINGVSVAENLTINGAGVSSTGALTGTGIATVTGTLAMGSSSSIGAANATDVLTISNVISGTGMNLTKVGAGTVILSAATANTYTGTTTVSGGTLQLGNGGTTGALDVNSTVSVGTGAVFAVNRSNAVAQGTDFSASTITGAGGFAQTGSGVTTLSTSGNSYSGGTTVNNGELRVTGSLTGGGSVIVGESGGSLTNAAVLAGAGNGTTTGVIAGAVTVGGVNSVGILTPGVTSLNADKGTLTITANNTALTVATGSQIQLGITTPTTAAVTNYSYTFNIGGTPYATAKDYFDALGAGADVYTKGAPTASTNHDFINLSGTNSTLSVGNRSGAAWGQGSIVVNSVGAVSAQQGQVFNLIDWSGANLSGGFGVGAFNTYDASTNVIAGDLDLAALGGGLAWDVSAFSTYGVIVVVPSHPACCC
ncbi:MAG: autotransporter-associated beta strand repeat-containing protein, partial [Verrucomicrobia bacterium]|nr:autotransporter-associated beta strand repeat-containing protein [Verrucomicrobiota bacterium]